MRVVALDTRGPYRRPGAVTPGFAGLPILTAGRLVRYLLPLECYTDCSEVGVVTRTQSLTQRKMRRTRQAIADAALRLFTEYGFDQVTVAQIAAAAEVAEKTIYNHFGGKAELVLDADHDLLDELLAAVRDRPVGWSALAAVRDVLAGAATQLGEGAPRQAQLAFRRLVADSPTLQAHQRQMAARYERALAQVLAAETGATPGSAEPFLSAVGLIGALRAGFETAEHRGGRAAATHRALDLLEVGLAEYAIKPAPSSPAPKRPSGRDSS